jgi:hypothetical protein
LNLQFYKVKLTVIPILKIPVFENFSLGLNFGSKSGSAFNVLLHPDPNQGGVKAAQKRTKFIENIRG